ncbi:MAG: hypothetical protein DWQ29_19785 [Planctomycetota bacterium]|nr:MAG: hypothetical protein DWQ29_19785 [Planctomycetota bacterium]
MSLPVRSSKVRFVVRTGNDRYNTRSRNALTKRAHEKLAGRPDQGAQRRRSGKGMDSETDLPELRCAWSGLHNWHRRRDRLDTVWGVD